MDGLFQGIKSRILHSKISIPPESKELKAQIALFKSKEKKEELRQIIEDMGLRKGNQIGIKEMDLKLKMLEELFEEYAETPERMEELEQRLGIPVSYASRAVVPYAKKVKTEDRDAEKKKAEEAAMYIEKIRTEADELAERRKKKVRHREEMLALETEKMKEERLKREEERKQQMLEKLEHMKEEKVKKREEEEQKLMEYKQQVRKLKAQKY